MFFLFIFHRVQLELYLSFNSLIHFFKISEPLSVIIIFDIVKLNPVYPVYVYPEGCPKKKLSNFCEENTVLAVSRTAGYGCTVQAALTILGLARRSSDQTVHRSDAGIVSQFLQVFGLSGISSIWIGSGPIKTK